MRNICWVCNSEKISKIKNGLDISKIKTSDFMVTDARYGTTMDIYECRDCGFQFCPTDLDLVNLYEGMEDQEYIDTNSERSKQAFELYKEAIKFFSPNFKYTLDVGCGSGQFVECFKKNGFEAAGVEPSKSLSEFAIGQGLNVIQGKLQDIPNNKKFHFISLIDVIEHVDNPGDMMNNIKKFLRPDGIVMLVTPRTDSFFKKLLGFKWWHYRLAHVGYFSRKNLIKLCEDRGFEYIHDFSPSWYHDLNYILTRLTKYIPGLKNVKIDFFKNKSIRLNLGDSIAILIKNK
jgi:2-polyprenyl-3-methyl-5-hydroxy-6-metoxy-1,4-benzoquinol methylase